jgi:outer membrane protein TolC
LLALALLPLAALAGASPAAEAEAPALRIGALDELDLDRMRRAVGGARGEGSLAEARSLPPLTLETGIAIALQSNLRIQIAALARNAAEAEVPAARAFFHPSLGLDLAARGDRAVLDEDGVVETGDEQGGAGLLRQELPTGGFVELSSGVGHELGDELGDYQSSLAVELRQPLLRGGRIYVARRPILDAEYDLAIEEARFRAEILDVTADTTEAYFELVRAERIVEATGRAIERDRHLVQASEALFGGGRATRRDVVSAEISLARDEAQLAEARGELRTAEHRLRDVLGVPLAGRIELAEKEIPFDPIELEPDAWVRTALRARPEILELETRLRKAELEARIRANDVLPRLDAVGIYQRYGGASKLGSSLSLDGQGWQGGLAFAFPLGNVAARERLRRANFELQRTRRELVAEQREIEVEVREIGIALAASLEEIDALTRSLEKAREKREIAQERYRLGLANNLDVTDADAELLRAERQMLRAAVDHAIGIARLEARIAAPALRRARASAP